MSIQKLNSLFQSTLLVRGATSIDKKERLIADISIHAPRERSDANIGTFVEYDEISIHAPRERSDIMMSLHQRRSNIFQSTLLVRGATDRVEPFQEPKFISIHAPRERSDLKLTTQSQRTYYFNPRSS